MKERAMEEILGRHGMLAEGLEAYEYRPQQVEMAEAVLRALAKGGTLIVEAGPGTGKTFAYLIPALYSREKVVISTGTKNLQEQIFFKDIPLLREIFPMGFKVAYMKGRENYLCWRRFTLFSRQPLFKEMSEASFFEEVQKWVSQTQTGDRSELRGIPDDFSTWEEICCKRDQCHGPECPYQKKCHLTHMRQEAAEAQLIVVNHHLFFADLSVKDVGGEVIPRYKKVIFDEAHQLEEIITNFFGITISNYRVEELARDVRRDSSKGGKPLAVVQKRVDTLLEKTGDLFSLFQSQERYRLRELDPMVLSLLSDIKRGLSSLREVLGKRSWKEEIVSLIRRTHELEMDLEFILSMGDPTYVYWCENKGRGIFLRASPIDVWQELNKRLYPRVKSMVFTSATLSAQGGFNYFRERLGLEEAEELILPSPFDFQRQVVIYLPDGLPEPFSPDFTQAAAKEIQAILEVSRGRAFVLFTSYRNMREIHNNLRGKLPYRLLLQGEGSKHLLLEEFKADVHSILFATSSFWEGVDVPGPALSCVIIDKLPFDPPTEPVVEARIERIAAQGGDAFYQYQIPAAIMTLKQGLGRLIRSSEDRGILSILDSRLLTKGYGKLFLQSLPPAPVVRSREEIGRVFE